jgi:hypothetical protein
MDTKILSKKGYLYSMWSGKVKVYEGEVHYMPWNIIGRFNTIPRSNKTFMCSVEPEVVCNAVVWIETKDEKLARELLIDYENGQIKVLQKKIDNHLHKISVLEGVFYDE